MFWFLGWVFCLSQSEMENFTWPEVLACVMKAQRDVRMCMHKSNFTELGEYMCQ